MKLATRGGSLYFTVDEYKETLTDKEVDVLNQKPTKKKVYTYKSGAQYDGEWVGGFRHGYGT